MSLVSALNTTPALTADAAHDEPRSWRLVAAHGDTPRQCHLGPPDAGAQRGPTDDRKGLVTNPGSIGYGLWLRGAITLSTSPTARRRRHAIPCTLIFTTLPCGAACSAARTAGHRLGRAGRCRRTNTWHRTGWGHGGVSDRWAGPGHVPPDGCAVSEPRPARCEAGRGPDGPDDAGGEGRADDHGRARRRHRRPDAGHGLDARRGAVRRRLGAGGQHAGRLGRHGRHVPGTCAPDPVTDPDPVRRGLGARSRKPQWGDGLPAQHRAGLDR